MSARRALRSTVEDLGGWPSRLRWLTVLVVACWVAGAATGVAVLTTASGGAANGHWLTSESVRPDAVNLVPAPQALPSRLRISKIGVDTPLESLGLDQTGALEAPRDYAKAGWYARGILPGEPGPAVIAGHVDSATGPAVFFHLRELSAGDRIFVQRGEAVVGFTVTSVGTFPKNRFPTNLVYGATPDSELRLITCGGTFDSAQASYSDNIVVFATLSH